MPQYSAGFFLSKEWFGLRNQPKPFVAYTSLVFRLKSEITFEREASCHSVTAPGDVYVRNEMKATRRGWALRWSGGDCHS